MAWIVRVVLLVLATAALAACGDAGSEAERRTGGSWERLPEPPPSQRASAPAVWMEGGEDGAGYVAAPCPTTAIASRKSTSGSPSCWSY